jgi:hypothetical protein
VGTHLVQQDAVVVAEPDEHPLAIGTARVTIGQMLPGPA